MKLHLLGLPHTQTTRDYLTCAYTQKLVRFGKMMKPLGYETILYAGEENDAEDVEHVSLLTERERLEWFRPRDPNDADFGGVNWDPSHPSWLTFNGRAIGEIARRAEPRDLLLLSMGCCHQMVADSLPHLTACEPGVGYHGVSSEFRAFESYAWMHFVYGEKRIVDGRYYDTVIPNYFDRADFTEATGPTSSDGYLLFLGRVIPRKGPHVAAQIAERLGKRLVVAGPGVAESQPGRIVSYENDWVLEGPVEYAGVLGVQERADLMRGADAVICPTQYVEPFGGVAVEAMLCGTPVVANDYGAFVETVEEGLTGYRFHTLAEGAAAVEKALELDRTAIRKRALERFSLEAVGPMFDRWFRQLGGLWDGGWNA